MIVFVVELSVPCICVCVCQIVFDLYRVRWVCSGCGTCDALNALT